MTGHLPLEPGKPCVHYPLQWASEILCLISERSLLLKDILSSVTVHLFLLLSAKKLTSIHLCEVIAISTGVNPWRLKLPPMFPATLTSNPCLCYCFLFLTPSNINELQSIFLTTQQNKLVFPKRFIRSETWAFLGIFISLWVQTSYVSGQSRCGKLSSQPLLLQ